MEKDIPHGEEARAAALDGAGLVHWRKAGRPEWLERSQWWSESRDVMGGPCPAGTAL